MFAIGSRIVMLNDELEVPPELLAYRVYNTVVELTLGVPEITPLSIDNPLGNAGVIVQFATIPPVLFAIISEIVTSLVNT